MRLIDADEIKKKKVYVIERHEKVVPVSEIDWADSIDIVQCKECTFRNEINCPQYYRRSELSDDWFCADGKRKSAE